MTPHRGEAGATTAEVPVDGPTLDGRALVDTAAPDIPPARVDDEPPAIGRYRVRRRLGAGAMGVVYAAYDEALDREVAVKLLHGDADHPRRDERLLREAQAMAKLSHPNVAQVYEAGIHDGEVFIAMELIHGTTLRRWLDAAARPWAAIVERFVAAGRGLQAAHAAGVVHRDFKPKTRSLLGRPPFSPSGRILKNRGVSRQGPWRVVSPCAAVLATGWQSRRADAPVERRQFSSVTRIGQHRDSRTTMPLTSRGPPRRRDPQAPTRSEQRTPTRGTRCDQRARHRDGRTCTRITSR